MARGFFWCKHIYVRESKQSRGVRKVDKGNKAIPLEGLVLRVPYV